MEYQNELQNIVENHKQYYQQNNYNINHDDDIIKTPEGLIFNPYNPLNIKITEADIKLLLGAYGLPLYVRNLEIYQRAFIHRSYTKRPNYENKQQNIKIVAQPPNCLPLSSKSNERLEFLGDGILECITKLYLYKRFPKENEGFMTEKKIAIVKNESIGKIAYEMGLHNWLILSKHAEEKKIRINLKKLGCLFESFIGAMFLDFNKIDVNDEDGWFKNVFITGPGFQMVQIFVENVFEKHVDWITLIQNDDNFKNILQVKIQKEFKVTPHYCEIEEHNVDTGFHMGVYLCLGQPIHTVNKSTAILCSAFNSYNDMHQYMSEHGKMFVFLGEGTHKIKKKAEQVACETAIQNLSGF